MEVDCVQSSWTVHFTSVLDKALAEALLIVNIIIPNISYFARHGECLLERVWRVKKYINCKEFVEHFLFFNTYYSGFTERLNFAHPVRFFRESVAGVVVE